MLLLLTRLDSYVSAQHARRQAFRLLVADGNICFCASVAHLRDRALALDLIDGALDVVMCTYFFIAF